MQRKALANNYEHLKREGYNWLKASCSTCDEEQLVRFSKGAKTCSQATANKWFSNKGWDVGKRRQDDMCPACVMKFSARAVREDTRSDEAAAQREAVVDAVAGPAPADEETQFIVEFIGEKLRTTASGRRGYIYGWTDERVLLELSRLYPHLTKVRVRAIRVSAFGSARAKRVMAEDRIALLEQQMVRLQEYLNREVERGVVLKNSVDDLSAQIEFLIGPKKRRA